VNFYDSAVELIWTVTVKFS